MHLNEIIFTDARPIDGYGPGFFRIGGKVIQGAVLVTPVSSGTWGGFDDTQALIALAAEIDVLFIGTGADTAHLPPDFRAALEEAGLGVEAMATAPAARTFNILLSEGRRVAAALLAV